jgi:hypothetical protein
VPSCTELLSGYACRSYWDSFSTVYYWNSTERNATQACFVTFSGGFTNYDGKVNTRRVRAFRCVTY